VSEKKNRSIVVQGTQVGIVTRADQDYVSLTDIARYRNSEHTDDLIRNWLRNRNTLEFLGIWERLNNPAFKPVEFDGIRIQAGLNSFTLTPKQWIERTAAVGITSKPGRYGGTYAHKDIAFEFATWISMEFKVYLVKEFRRLKEAELAATSPEWTFQRTLAKVNYRIHTDAIQEHLIPRTTASTQHPHRYPARRPRRRVFACRGASLEDAPQCRSSSLATTCWPSATCGPTAIGMWIPRR